MQSTNPVLTRYEKSGQAGGPGQPGYAYAEGVNAYSQATAAGAAPGTPAAPGAYPGARLTINDVVVKTAMIFAVLVVFAVIGWNTYESMPWLMIVGLIGGLVLGIVNAVKAVPSPVLMLLYGVFEGVVLGAVSQWYNQYALGSGYEGIVLQAVVATMVTFGVMLALYLTGVVKVTKRFASVLIVAMVSYLVLGLASLVAALFGVGGGWGFYGITGLGLIIAVLGVILAAFFLMLDFEAIAQGIRMGVPERESWRMAFGLTVTLVWLYLEFLRFLAIFTRN